jgi:hypothetical protein
MQIDHRPGPRKAYFWKGLRTRAKYGASMVCSNPITLVRPIFWSPVLTLAASPQNLVPVCCALLPGCNTSAGDKARAQAATRGAAKKGERCLSFLTPTDLPTHGSRDEVTVLLLT